MARALSPSFEKMQTQSHVVQGRAYVLVRGDQWKSRRGKIERLLEVSEVVGY